MADKTNENSEEVFPPDIKKCLESIAKKEGYITYKISKKNDDSGGQGYQALTYAVDIKGKTAEGDKETNIYVKQAFRTEYMETYTYGVQFYETETFFYSDLGKLLAQMQEDANIPIEDRFNVVKGYEESNSDVTFMENVLEKGYRPCERMDRATLKYLELSIQQLARLHGLSYVIKKKRPDYYKEKLLTLKYPLKLNDVWNSVIANASKIFCQDLNEETKKRAEAYIPTVIKKYTFYMEENTPYNCLTHGDYRMMNIMKKEIDGEITEVIPIDYQNFYTACPLNDFFYLVYGCTDREMRKQHLNHLKDLYYDSLDSILKYFDMTAEEVFPRKAYV